MTTTSERPAPSTVLPTATLVVGLISPCLPPLVLVTVVMGIVCLSRSARPGYQSQRGYVFGGLAVAVVGVALKLFVVLLVLPSYQRFPVRSKQAECRANLKGVYAAQRSFFLEHERYTTSAQELGFTPERRNRYLYRLSPSGTLALRTTAAADDLTLAEGFGVDEPANGPGTAAADAAIPPSLRATLGVHGSCPACEFTAVCAGNLDEDPTIDVWSVSSLARTSPTGEPIPPGVPFNDVNDVTD